MGAAFTRTQGWAFLAILLVAAGLRAWAALTTGPVHPDELFQYLEPAHRKVFGYGVVTWEYRYGMRSWLLPLLLSVPMQLGAWIAPDGGLYLALPRLAAAALSLLAVVGAYALGARLSRFHGLVAMAVAATWYDIAYFGGHVLTESLSTALILPAAAILLAEAPRRRGLVLAGVLFGLAGILRFHYLPAIAVLAVLSCGLDWRGRWAPLFLGGVAAAAIGAAVDLAMGQAPFGWIAVNFTQNIVADRAAGFGVHPPLTYLVWLVQLWGFALGFILLLVLPVLRPYRPLIWAAAANLVLHSLIGHKEYRFIFLTVAILVVVAAIGSAEFLRRMKPRLPGRAAPLAAAALLSAWFGTSAALAAGRGLESGWRGFLAGSEAALALRAEPRLCGVGVLSMLPLHVGGSTILHRRVPFYVDGPPFGSAGDTPIASSSRAFNGAIVPEDKIAQLPAGYRRIACSAPETGVDPADPERPVRVCALLREGGCDSAAGASQELQAVMKRRDS